MPLREEIKIFAIEIVVYFSLILFGAPQWGAIIGCVVTGEFLYDDWRTRAERKERENTATRMLEILERSATDFDEIKADFDGIKDQLENLGAQMQTLKDTMDTLEYREAAIHPRINKETLWLTKREEGGADEFWIRLHFSEDAGQGGEEFGLGGKVAIVGSVLSGVLP